MNKLNLNIVPSPCDCPLIAVLDSQLANPVRKEKKLLL